MALSDDSILRRNTTILVVDDDDSFRTLIRDTLGTILPPERILTATDGDEAWWILTDPDRTIDVLLLDLSMPRVNGIALLQRIRQHSKFETLPVILCTGTSTRESVTQAVRHKVVSYMVKPFPAGTLIEKVEEVLVQRSQFH